MKYKTVILEQLDSMPLPAMSATGEDVKKKMQNIVEQIRKRVHVAISWTAVFEPYNSVIDMELNISSITHTLTVKGEDFNEALQNLKNQLSLFLGVKIE